MSRGPGAGEFRLKRWRVEERSGLLTLGKFRNGLDVEIKNVAKEATTLVLPVPPFPLITVTSFMMEILFVSCYGVQGSDLCIREKPQPEVFLLNTPLRFFGHL